MLSAAAAPVGRLSAVELARGHKSAALRDAVRALTRHQGFMVGVVVWLLCLAVFLLPPPSPPLLDDLVGTSMTSALQHLCACVLLKSS